MAFFTCLCIIQLVFLAAQSIVVDQQPICWAGQPTETSTRFFIKPQKQRSTMFVLRPKTLRQGLSGGGGKTEQKDKKELMCSCYPNKAGAILLGNKVCRWHPHVTYPTVGILTSSHTSTTEKVNIRIKLRFTGHVHIHSQHSLSTTQKIHIYTSSAYLCIQMMIDHTTIFIHNSQKDSDIHMFSMFMHPNDWDHGQYDPWTNFNYLGYRLVNGVQSEVLLAEINACTSNLSST